MSSIFPHSPLVLKMVFIKESNRLECMLLGF